MNLLQNLKERLAEISDIQHAADLLHWDQATYMPAGGAEARGQQISTLSKLAHEKLTAPQLGELLDQLSEYEKKTPFESNDASLIRVTRRTYEKAVKIPSEFQARFSEHTSSIYQAWISARPTNDFKKMIPYLEKTVDLSRELAHFFPGYVHIADPLIDFADEGMTVEMLQSLFAALRKELVPLVESIVKKPTVDDRCLHLPWPEAQQLKFGRQIIESFGYDFNRGRQDKTHHPFMTKFGLGDVRITTRIKEKNINEALFSTLHEAGHALYEQGINPLLERTPLAKGTSSGVHESQSRLWENIVGRSLGFWKYWYPILQPKHTALSTVSLDEFYRAINKVIPSLIRTDADEVTYNLHVMIRFDLELALLEGRLQVKDLADAWNARYQSDLGVTPPDDRDGVLQDIHWFCGTVGGAFQCYTIGNILSAQFFETACHFHPEILKEIEKGRYHTLLKWLQKNIYDHGSKFTAPELIQRVTDNTLTVDPYIRYLKNKFFY